MGIEPTYQLITGTLDLKSRRPTRRLGTSVLSLSYRMRKFSRTGRGDTDRLP